ncbi:MAG: response regulator [Candidatus Cloacimonadales bacterium]|nr:response regulator [Candidatus Cloacimonadales bacterium]
MKILIVDDEITVTQYLKLELEDCCQDLEVITENTGYEALNRLMQGDINLLLTDIAMPDMDGYELYSRAKEYDENLPIIMMTGFGYDPGHAIVKSRRDGLQDVLFKPFETQKLFDLIKKRVMGE